MKVEYMGHFGSDLMVVDAARCSFDKKSSFDIIPDEDGPRDKFNYPINLKEELKEADKKLIKYLARSGHDSPFFHPQIQVRVTVPIFVANQLKRHQVGLALNEVSRRYVDTEPEFHSPVEWRGRPPKSIKQGSSDEVITHIDSPAWGVRPITDIYESYLDNCSLLYRRMIDGGIAPEQARMVLPQSMLTTWIWTGSLMAFLRVYRLRSDSHAQKESQIIAEQLKEIIQPLFPVSWDAWFNREDK